MILSKKYYILFRVYPDDPERNRLYGWSMSKNVIKAIMSQRDKSKYLLRKFSIDEISEKYSENSLDINMMIDKISLTSAATKEDVMFFSTKSELMEAEVRIQKMFRDLPRLVDRCNGELDVLELFHNLKNYYHDALDFIGMRPTEIEAIFDRDNYVSCENSIESIIDSIENAYIENERTLYLTGKHDMNKPIGLDMLDETYTKVLYSLEAFIKVLKEDL